MCTCRWTDAFSETKTWEMSTGVFTACCNFNNITAVAAMAWRPTILINSTKAVEIQQSFCVKPSAVVQKRNHLKQPASWYSIQYKALRIDLKSYCKKVITSIFSDVKKLIPHQNSVISNLLDKIWGNTGFDDYFALFLDTLCQKAGVEGIWNYIDFKPSYD